MRFTEISLFGARTCRGPEVLRPGRFTTLGWQTEIALRVERHQKGDATSSPPDYRKKDGDQGAKMRSNANVGRHPIVLSV